MLNALRKRWRDFVTGGTVLSAQDPRFGRAVLLHVVLLAGVLATLLFAVFHALITGYNDHALAAAMGFLGFLGTLGYLRRSKDIDGAGAGAVLVIMFVILAVVISGGTRDFALFWIALFPPVPFVLLGARRGLVFTLVFFGIAFFSFTEGMNHWAAARLNHVALVNIGGTLFGLVVFVWYYEASRAETHRKLEQAAISDFLTALANRRRFLAQFEVEMARADRHGLPLSLLLLDVDHFKRINDLHGHQVGDAVLRHLAAVLLDNLRRSDVVGRLGGEEFGVLLPHTTALQAARVGEKLRDAVEHTPMRSGSEVIPFTISVGAAENGPSRADFSSLFAVADRRLSHAKQLGRNRVVAC
jgi:diguanylate cyclase (GGDEF)-like protein